MTAINKAYTEIVKVNTSNGQLSMSIVQKESESGLTYNERLLFLLHGNAIGYIPRFNPKEQAQKLNLNHAKLIVPFNRVSLLSVDGKDLKIYYGERTYKWLIFRFTTSLLAQKWRQMIIEETQKFETGGKQFSVYEDDKLSESSRSRHMSDISQTNSQASFISNTSSQTNMVRLPVIEENLNPEIMWKQMLIRNRLLEAELTKKNEMIQNMGYQISHLQNRVIRLEDRNVAFRH